MSEKGSKKGVKKVTKNDHFWAKIDPFLTPFLPGHRGQRGQWVKKKGSKNDPKNAKNGQMAKMAIFEKSEKT